mgnify:FL=1
MTFETWFAFVLASTAVVLIPGPNVVITVTAAISHGKRSGLATVPGVVAGAFVAMVLSLAGAGAVLATSATLFAGLKLAGALYLFWMAYQLWTAPVGEIGMRDNSVSGTLYRLFIQSFLISALTPKGPIFYIAFVPQFVTVHASAFEQFAILILTFLCVATVNSIAWLYGAHGLRRFLSKKAALRRLNRFGAAFLFLAGVFTLRVSRLP